MRISEKYTVTEDMVNKFAEISGDLNPLHIDDNFAKNSIFGRKISHGMLLGSLISSVIANKYPGPGSIYLSQTLEFKNPCFVGDSVVVQIELINQDRHKYFLNTSVLRDDLILIEGKASILNKNNINTL